MIDRRQFLGASLLALPAFGTLPAWGQAPARLKIGFTATSDAAAGYIAQEEGMFSKRKLDTELQLVALNSTLPAALQAGSLQIGNPSPSVLLAAVEGGIDLVTVGCTSVVNKSVVNFGAVARTGSGIEEAKDFIGKRVGVPGLNAFLHVLFRKWLSDRKVDFRRVTFVETPYPQMPDIVRGGSVDAVVTAEPVMGRIIAAGSGKLITHMAPDLAEELPTALWGSTREWASKNSDAVRRFQEANAEAVEFFKKEPAKCQEYISKYTRLPIEVVRSVPLPQLRANVTERDLEAWVEIMMDQGMLSTKLDVKRLRFT
jgi:NitT/TauT family transport system substrate-binding protein